MNDIKRLVFELRSALFWVITQKVVVISFRRFGTTYCSQTQGSRIQKFVFWILDS